MSENEDKKVEKYQDLAREIRIMWDVRTSCDSGGNGGIRISTNEFGKQPEGY